ncbi:MAG TPA: permease-like cell division protein FtsX, partial [bacterium]|nr:permease-like cell division protein FtsX [bacterium]
LDDNISLAQRQKIEEELKTLQSIIEMIKFIDKDAALEDLRMKSKELPQLIEGIIDNPLPAYYEIELKKIDDKIITAFKQIFSNLAGIESVDYGEKNLYRLEELRKKINITMISVSVIMALFILFIIYNIQQLAIFNRREEIEIQKMIGATKMNIRLPFLIETLIIIIISIILAQGFLFAIYKGITNNIINYSFFKNYNLLFFDKYELLYIFCGFCFIAIFAAVIAVSKFLNMTTDED